VDTVALEVGAALENFPLENPKKPFLVPRTQPKLGKWAALNVAFSPCLFFPISGNAIFIEIDPCGKIFAMNIQRAHGIGVAVAWGHHLHVHLRCQNCDLSTPSGDKTPTEHQKHNNKHDDDMTSVFVSNSHDMQQVFSSPPQPTTPVPPQIPPQHTFNLG
jgi:hypothetical protein